MVKLVREKRENMGYGFIESPYLREGEDEYRFRFIQNPRKDYRPLSQKEREILTAGDNRADDWDRVLVSPRFDPRLITGCVFRGLVRLGDLEEGWLQYHDLKLPCGLSDCTIISCDLGNNVALANVHYLSHYIIGDHSILFNIDEMSVTDHAKFGNGVVMEGEKEEVRVRIETANEKGTRDILPFEGILPGDGWFWAKFRDRPVFQENFKKWTDDRFPPSRGRYGTVGRDCVIKSCRIIKDVLFGDSTYVKGANKLKNLTLAGTEEQPIQIGEGVELVNGIIHRGARVFYGVKAVRFILGEESQLKYGARLINSYLGENSTISCCEVLNALIFPFHEQHHNNSFLIASNIQGQSNMAAGATVGSNHNSRGSDGEIVAERGFWPGLNVSLKHNSKFAPFTLLSKGAYPAELNIELPFSLLSNDESRGMLTVMPAYWFHYNMYAMARNSWKYRQRDKRRDAVQDLEFHYLAPDSAQAILRGRELLESWCGPEKLADPAWDPADIVLETHAMEKGRRPVRILRPARAWRTYGKLLEYYFALNLITGSDRLSSRQELARVLEGCETGEWFNAGGQMVSHHQIRELEEDILRGGIASWEDLHRRYREWGAAYSREKLRHSAACWFALTGKSALEPGDLKEVITAAEKTAAELLEVTRMSREKDFTQFYRNITFSGEEEKYAVLGKPEEDDFIKTQEEEYLALTVSCEKFLKTFGG